jgi:hypothetical protein
MKPKFRLKFVLRNCGVLHGGCQRKGRNATVMERAQSIIFGTLVHTRVSASFDEKVLPKPFTIS